MTVWHQEIYAVTTTARTQHCRQFKFFIVIDNAIVQIFWYTLDR